MSEAAEQFEYATTTSPIDQLPLQPTPDDEVHDDNPNHQDGKVQGVHLVGSIPLATNEVVFNTVATGLDGRVKRIPDGETGKRGFFCMWQRDQIGEPNLVRRCFNPNAPAALSREEEDEMFDRILAKDLRTAYDEAALESYAVFKRVRQTGVIPDGVRFQVSLPSSLSVVALETRTEFHARFEPMYHDALSAALAHIQRDIPAKDLAIQFDCPIEMAMLEQVQPLGPDEPLRPWFSPVLDGLASRAAALLDAVQPGVEAGLHICYGDIGGRHFTQPADTQHIVDFAMAVLDRVHRKVNWIHLPVPKDRIDTAYFSPLRPLVATSQTTGLELMLGLVHHGDLEGTRKRIQAASKICPQFSVATSCGMGRHGHGSPAANTVFDVFDICREVAGQY